MVDNSMESVIIISARLLNRNGKEPGTGALSHSFVNQTKLYFGSRVTRLITGLFNGLAASNSNRSDWAGDFFYLTKIWPGCKDARNTPTPLPLANLSGGQPMANGNIPLQGSFNNSPIPESNLDSIRHALQLEETQYIIDFLKSHIIEQISDLAALLRRNLIEACDKLLAEIVELMGCLAYWMQRVKELEGSNG
jgi:hypothetical protein